MKKLLLPLFPALAAFGPLFMVMGTDEHAISWLRYVGAMMTSIALLSMLAFARPATPRDASQV